MLDEGDDVASDGVTSSVRSSEGNSEELNERMSSDRIGSMGMILRDSEDDSKQGNST